LSVRSIQGGDPGHCLSKQWDSTDDGDSENKKRHGAMWRERTKNYEGQAEVPTHYKVEGSRDLPYQKNETIIDEDLRERSTLEGAPERRYRVPQSKKRIEKLKKTTKKKKPPKQNQKKTKTTTKHRERGDYFSDMAKNCPPPSREGGKKKSAGVPETSNRTSQKTPRNEVLGKRSCQVIQQNTIGGKEGEDTKNGQPRFLGNKAHEAKAHEKREKKANRAESSETTKRKAEAQ